MAGTEELRDGVERDAVVRSFGRAVERPCARPSCAAPARATLTFRYATREAWLERLAERTSPQTYDLCATHAARTRPPEGWQLRDRRPEDERRPDVPHTTPVDLGGDRTVAVLAAALRSVPDPVSEDAVADDAEVDRTVVLEVPAGASLPGPVAPAPADAVAPAVLALDEALAPTLDLAGSSAQLAEPPLDPEPAAGTGGPRPPLAVRDRTRDGSAASDW